ncbi:hypothetical protein [Rheinheimera gaetbuli]
MKQAFLFFHLNLAFSSIPEEARSTVIKQCYWPLLELIRLSKIPIGVEMTAWTMEQISLIDPAWIKQLRELLAEQRCELIGSGWSQLIGPLVPYKVNLWNQQLALEAYKKHLNYTPSIVLVNEMAFSSSLVELYNNFNYSGMIMDRDNIKLSLNVSDTELPTHALGNNGNNNIAVLWSDSVLFQRLQRAVHGDIPLTQYFAYVEQRMKSDQLPLAIYANDAEIFDYRPGRFSTEGSMHPEGEWNRLLGIIKHLQDKMDVNFIAPSAALSASLTKSFEKKQLTSIRHPVPVKKQAKYNINRWAAAGRNNVWLNTLCHKRFQQIENESDPHLWRELCEFWSSDLRTHITASRWQNCLNKLVPLTQMPEKKLENSIKALPQLSNLQIRKDSENFYWHCQTDDIKLSINLRRGIAIDSLAFRSWQFKPLITTHHQGEFDTIDLAADFYSGGIVIELPGQRRRITDLEWVTPILSEDADNYIISAQLKTAEFTLVKTLKLSKQEEKLSIHYHLGHINRIEATIRLGVMTVNMKHLQHPAQLKVWQGGATAETFLLDQNCDHTQSVSSLVSSTTSFGSAGGNIVLGDNSNAIQFNWIPSQCAAVPMLINKSHGTKQFTRLLFSLCELDDTFKQYGYLPDFELEIRPGKLVTKE